MEQYGGPPSVYKGFVRVILSWIFNIKLYNGINFIVSFLFCLINLLYDDDTFVNWITVNFNYAVNYSVISRKLTFIIIIGFLFVGCGFVAYQICIRNACKVCATVFSSPYEIAGRCQGWENWTAVFLWEEDST